MSQMTLLSLPNVRSDIVYTPEWAAKDIIDWFKPIGTILEPCRGGGAFFNNFPPGAEKHWCEIQDGKDFLLWNAHVDWIITNPPYSMLKEFLDHSYSVADNIVFLFPLSSFFRNGSIMNLSKKRGWIKHIRNYGGGGQLGFPMGNPIGAFHFQKNYTGPTSWSWYKSGKG